MDPNNGLLEPASIDATNNNGTSTNNDNASAMQLFAPDPNGGENVSLDIFSMHQISRIYVYIYEYVYNFLFIQFLSHCTSIIFDNLIVRI